MEDSQWPNMQTFIYHMYMQINELQLACCISLSFFFKALCAFFLSLFFYYIFSILIHFVLSFFFSFPSATFFVFFFSFLFLFLLAFGHFSFLTFFMWLSAIFSFFFTMQHAFHNDQQYKTYRNTCICYRSMFTYLVKVD